MVQVPDGSAVSGRVLIGSGLLGLKSYGVIARNHFMEVIADGPARYPGGRYLPTSKK